MERWEFLIQKQGDRSWQPIATGDKAPIESSPVEITEGRYRVVAHANRANLDVEIRVTHDSTTEIPPKRRSQRRSRRTNSEGLMVIVPFTYFKPGTWEFAARSSVMSDLLGNPWQQCVHLSVLPMASDLTAEVSEIHRLQELASMTVSDWEMIPAAETKQLAMIEETQAALAIESPTDTHQADLSTESTTDTLPIELVADSLTGTHQADLSIESATDTPPIELVADSLTGTHQASLSTEGTTDTPPTELVTESATDTPQADLSTESATDTPLTELVTTTSVDTATVEETSEESLTTTNTDLDIPVIQTRMALHQLDGTPTSVEQLLEESRRVAEEILGIVVDPLLEELDAPPEEEAIAFGVAKPIAQRSGVQPFGHENLGASGPEAPIAFTPTTESLLLTLDQETLIWQRGESLILSGQIEALEVADLLGGDGSSDWQHSPVSDREARRRSAERIFQGTLGFELRDPQTSQVLVSEQQSLQSPLPLTFSYSLKIPDDCQSRLILGEAILSDRSFTITTQSFSVTAALDELLDAIEQSDAATEEETATLNEQPLNTVFLELVETPKPTRAFQATSPQPLPPVISRPDTTRTIKSLELPQFMTAQTTSEATVADLSEVETLDIPEETTDIWQDTEPVEAPIPLIPELPADEPPSPVDEAFEALNLPDRFWSRLNALMSDEELSNLLIDEQSLAAPTSALELPPAVLIPEPQLEEVPEPLLMDWDSEEWASDTEAEAVDFAAMERAEMEAQALMSSDFSGVEAADWGLFEVVVEDEDSPIPEPAPMSDASGLPYPFGIVPPSESRFQDDSSDVPVPAPTILVMPDELTAGEGAIVRVKLPPEAISIYVKLWIQDRQSRSLLDGPRWLVDFLPDSSGALETMTQVMVPFGTVEVRLEAIAINTYTQRESHKVTIDRVVLPPNLPNFSLEEFEEPSF